MYTHLKLQDGTRKSMEIHSNNKGRFGNNSEIDTLI